VQTLRHPLEPIFLAGPTAVGKSAVALELATRLGGEIISVDSMQVYRGLDVGTAKPSPAERARVPHHLIDVVEVTQPFDAARFLALARAATAEVRSRGRRPVFCGGTGLYFKAWFEGLGDTPPADAALRAELEAQPLESLLRELAGRDPATFARIDRQNARRVIRALEVIRLTGKPFSGQRAAWSSNPDAPAPAGMWCLARPPADLRARIEFRVDEMFRRGLVDEARALLRAGLAENRTAMQALGYRQVVEHLRGERDLPATLALVKTKTWQFARRQMTWFRRQLPVAWLDIPANEPPARTAQRIITAACR
jgi:tRNA dimethylallyltransferase